MLTVTALRLGVPAAWATPSIMGTAPLTSTHATTTMVLRITPLPVSSCPTRPSTPKYTHRTSTGPASAGNERAARPPLRVVHPFATIRNGPTLRYGSEMAEDHDLASHHACVVVGSDKLW